MKLDLSIMKQNKSFWSQDSWSRYKTNPWIRDTNPCFYEYLIRFLHPYYFVFIEIKMQFFYLAMLPECLCCPTLYHRVKTYKHQSPKSLQKKNHFRPLLKSANSQAFGKNLSERERLLIDGLNFYVFYCNCALCVVPSAIEDKLTLCWYVALCFILAR